MERPFDADKELVDAEGNTVVKQAYFYANMALKYIIEPNMEKVDEAGNPLAKPAEDADQATKVFLLQLLSKATGVWLQVLTHISGAVLI